jgi:hypothetical protein
MSSFKLSANALFVGVRSDSSGGNDDDALPLWKAHIINLVSVTDLLELHP